MATQSTKIGPGKVRVHVAAFGKHPGWDDHIEEIGLDSDELVRVKRLLYTEGMAGNIDAGAWEKLDEDKRLAAFRHVFYWKDRDTLIIGRLWSSTDGKGRSKYPMVVAAQVEGVPQWWAVEQILPRLEAAEARCVGGKTADAVRAAIGECRRGLEDSAAMLTASPTGGSGDPDLLRRLTTNPGLDAEGQSGLGLARILYEMDREMGAYKAGASRTRTSSVTIGPSHIRVPKCLPGPGEGARAWLALLKQELSPSSPVVVIEPLDHDWLDLVVGAPNPTSLFCVRTNESGLAYTSRIPYTIPPEFAASASTRVSAWVSGESAQARAAPAASAAQPESNGGGFSKWLVPAGGVLLVGLGVAILSIARCGGGGPTPQVAGTPPTPPVEAPTPKTEYKPDPKPAEPPAKPAPTPPKQEVAQASDPKPTEPTPQAVKPAEPRPESVAAVRDPRAAWTFAADLQRVSGAVETLDAAVIAEGGEADTALRGRLSKLGDRAELVRAMPWSDANADAIRRGVDGIAQDLAAIDKDVAEAVAAAQQRVRESLAEMPAPVTSEPFVKVWNDFCKSNPVNDGRAAATKRMNDAAAGLSKAESAFKDDPFAAPLPSGTPVDVGAITANAASKRSAAMTEAARAAAGGDEARAQTLATEYNAWASGARGLARKAAAVASALGSGAGLADTSDAVGGTVGEAVAAMAASPYVKELGPALGPVTSRVSELRALDASNDPDELLAAIAAGVADSSPMSLAKVFSSWRRLAAIGWPTDVAGLSRAGELASGPVAAAVMRVPSGARADVTSRNAAAQAAMWRNYVFKRGGTEEGLSAALAARSALGVGEDQEADLPGWLRYNLALRTFLRDIAGAGKPAGNDAALRAAAQKFLNQAADAQVMANPAAATFLAGVKALAEKPAEADVSKFGPGAVGWSYAPLKDGGAMFTWPRGGVDYKLAFLPVQAAGGERTMVSTTELPLGLFVEVVTAGGKWDDLRKVMGNLPITGGQDLREGPRAWVWARRGPEIMSLARVGATDLSAGWLPDVRKLSGNPYYSPELSNPPPIPSMETPVQYISPAAAVLVASNLGCRLPTSAEWAAAAGAKPGPANRRDSSWRKQFVHVQNLAQKGLVSPRPDTGAFWPSGMSKPDAASEGEPAVDTDDGVLWFSPVPSGETAFKDLVGNVAEFVVEDPAILAGKTSPTADEVSAALGRGDAVRVIGASALSHKLLEPTAPQGLNWTQAKEGYADVGMRLAFPVPAGAGGGPAKDAWQQLAGGAALLPPAE